MPAAALAAAASVLKRGLQTNYVAVPYQASQKTVHQLVRTLA